MRYFYFIPLVMACFTMYAQPGTPDITFGTGGRVNVDLGFFGQAPTALKVLPDGKMLVGGIHYNSPSSVSIPFLTRLATTGQIDSTFGVNGLAPVYSQMGYDANGLTIELQQDGKILIMYTMSAQSSLSFFSIVIRYDSDGSLDSTFGTNGQVLSPAGMKFFGTGFAIAPDGNVFVCGSVHTAVQGFNFAILGYKPNGAKNTGFGNNGRVEFNLGTSNDNLHDIAVQPDGKIVATGKIVDDFIIYDPMVALRLHADGTPDSTFAINGFFSDIYDYQAGTPATVHLLPDGDILVTGTGSASGSNGSDYALYKLKNNGTRDSSFGINGLRLFDFGADYEYINAADLQSNGAIFLGGVSNSTFIIAGMNAQGEPLQNFGSNGSINQNTVDVFNGLSSCNDLQQAPGNKLIAITTYDDSTNISAQKWAVIRLNNNDATNTGEIPDAALPPKLYPNPTSSGIFTLELTLDTPSELAISLFDAAGKNLHTLLHSTRDAGTWQESLRIPQQFAQGIYFLKVQTGNKVEVIPIVKN